MKKRNKSMLEGPLLPSIISYTLPIILTNFLSLSFNTADMIIVGQFCGNLSLASVSAASSPVSLVTMLFMGLSVGVSVTVAHAIGSKDDQDIEKTVHTALPFAVLIGVTLTIIGLFVSKPLLLLLNTPESVLPLSDTYLKIYFFGMTFSIVYGYCSAILRAAGDTKSPLIFLGISGCVNVALNVVFVTLIQLDVAGVALATVISQAVSASLVIYVLSRRTDACKLRLRKICISGPHLLKIIRIGLPAGIQSSLFAISNTLVQSSVNSFGEVFMSGNAAATNIESYIYTSVNSFSQASVNFIGQNYGAKQYDRIKKVIRICLGCVIVLGVLLGQIAYWFGQNLLSIFLPDSPDSIAYGLVRITIVCTTYFLCGLMDVVTGGLRGMGASTIPMIVSVIGICGLRVGWITTVFQLPQFHTPQHLFYCYPLSWIVTFSIQVIIFSILYRKNQVHNSVQ